MSVENELQQLQLELEKLEERKKALILKQEEAATRIKKLEDIIEASGLGSAQALAEALIEAFDITISKAKPSPAKEGERKRRPRTKVTVELRDRVKSSIAEGYSKNKIAQSLEISYPVITKIIAGEYDNL